ncbi:concanavalin A-like lectin/glucanase domain-containing protein [Russula emetica]|nr:concanavalin A-like lectin/glucanase domain-containing protein [Russula emetica]
MRTGYAFPATLLLFLIPCASANFYLTDKWVGEDFFQGWNWETEDDPTHGRVNYVDQADALANNLTYADDSSFVMRADDWSIVSPSARGRDSVRISSQTAYGDSIIVLDLAHMPAGCATWPAFWTLSQAGPWPNGGEIDIIEGVNQQQFNQATLHTTPGCQMPSDPMRLQSGSTLDTNCDTSVNGNAGCGVSLNNSGPSYGTAFNMNGGGYFAMARSQTLGIKIYFWPRDSAYIPPEIVECGSGGGYLYPDPSWGIPAADFPMYPDLCNYNDHFNAHQIVFDLTFCGDWAGNAWPTSGCGSGACVDYVNNNPSAFSEAYWDVNSLRVYTNTSSGP